MIALTDENSWSCEIHAASKCRIYPKTQEALDKHYAESERPGFCWHGRERERCVSCRLLLKGRKRGRGREVDPTAIKHKVGIRMDSRNKHERRDSE